MAQLIVTIPNFSLTSKWTARGVPFGDPDLQNYNTSYSTPSTASSAKTVDLSSIPPNSTITSAVYAGSTNGAGDSRAKVSDIVKNVTNDFSVDVLSWFGNMASFGALSITHTFQAYGGTGSASYNQTTTYSRTSNFSNLTLTINYTLPASTGTLGGSTISAGQSIALTISPVDSGSSHKAIWSFGLNSETHTIAAGVTSDSMTIPLSWLSAIPSSTSGGASVTLETYNAVGTKTGQNTYTFTVTAPETVVPTIGSFTVAAKAIDGVNESPFGIFIQSKSRAHLSATGCNGAYGSTISSYLITGGGFTSTLSSCTTEVIPYSGNITYTLTVTDSRGRTATGEQTIVVNAYSAPNFSTLSVRRCTSTGASDDMGTFIGILASFTCSAVGSNSVSATYQWRQVGGSYSSASVLTGGAQVILGGADATKSYDVLLILSDALTTVTRTVTVSSARFAIHARPNAAGIAFGKASESDGLLDCAWPMRVRGNTTINGDLAVDNSAVIGNSLTVNGSLSAGSLSGAPILSDAAQWRSALGLNDAPSIISVAGGVASMLNAMGLSGVIGGVISYYMDASGGYVKFGTSGGGVVLQYRKSAANGSMTAWGDVYYRGAAPGNWQVPMTSLWACWSGLAQDSTTAPGWPGTVYGANTVSAGTVRIFQASSTSVNRTVMIFALGTW